MELPEISPLIFKLTCAVTFVFVTVHPCFLSDPDVVLSCLMCNLILLLVLITFLLVLSSVNVSWVKFFKTLRDIT